jgi:hypothetical protein
MKSLFVMLFLPTPVFIPTPMFVPIPVFSERVQPIFIDLPIPPSPCLDGSCPVIQPPQPNTQKRTASNSPVQTDASQSDSAGAGDCPDGNCDATGWRIFRRRR